MALSMLMLKIVFDGKAVVGESTTNGYEGQIELDSFEWSVTAKHTEKGKDGVHTEVRPKTLTVAKPFDRSTARLCRHMDERKMFSTAHLTALSMVLAGTNDRNLKVMEMVLSDGHIDNIGLQANESGKSLAVKERVTLSFRKCQMLYYPPHAKLPVRGAAMTFDLDQASVKG